MSKMDFQITLVGLNHRTAGVDVRERFALTSHCSPETWAAPCIPPLNESFILSTCNRVELLGVGANPVEEALLKAWAQACQSDTDALRPFIYTHHNLEAARHVFEVAASLDSMILGEPQILGQMKTAYRKSVESRGAGAIINRLMHKAFSVAKRVRSETAVASSAVSISYAAVELARRIFGQMAEHSAMLIGAGEMAELAAMHLIQAGMTNILIANRTQERAEELARRFHGQAITFAQLFEKLGEVDIVIASTGSSEPLINAAHVRKALKSRRNRPMFFIDIAVPRDIAPDVNALDNVYLYDIDDLREVVEENMRAREAEAERARAIIREEVTCFGEWLENLAAKPTILELVRRGEEAAEFELARTLRRLGPVNEETRQAIATMAHALARKLNHEPIMFLKSDGMGGEATPARIGAVRRIFSLDREKKHHD